MNCCGWRGEGQTGCYNTKGRIARDPDETKSRSWKFPEVYLSEYEKTKHSILENKETEETRGLRVPEKSSWAKMGHEEPEQRRREKQGTPME